MLTSIVFLASKLKEKPKIDENSTNRRSRNSYVLRDLMNFNETSGKNLTYDYIKNHQITKCYTLFRQYIF